MSNPFEQQDLIDEAVFTGHMADAIINAAYDGRRGAIECEECGEKTAWYRDTVGAHVCTECGEVM